jgi:hypothetical protein
LPTPNSAPATGQIFSENWEEGSIDTSIWSTTNAGSISVVDDGTGSNKALQMGGAGSYLNGLPSAGWTFGRGANIRCAFKWWTVCKNAAVPNDAFWIAPNGPWYKFPFEPIAVQLANLGGTEEAGITGQYMHLTVPGSGQATQNYTQLSYFGENGMGFQAYNALEDANWNTPIMLARTKATAMYARVTLGDATGACCERSTDGGTTWVKLFLHDGTTVLDTRGFTAGSTFGATKIGSQPVAWLGFGGGYGVAADGSFNYIDDITVNRGPGGPPALPTATSTTVATATQTTVATATQTTVPTATQTTVPTTTPVVPVELSTFEVE